MSRARLRGRFVARALAPLIAVLLAAVGVMSPVLGAADAWAGRASIAEERTTCCGGNCRCGESCPCVAREPEDGSPEAPLAPSEDGRSTRVLSSILLAATSGAATIAPQSELGARLGVPEGLDAAPGRPAGRRLLARVSKWTT